MPTPEASSAYAGGRKNSTPRMYTAPRMAPGSDPSPPMTTIENRRSDTSALNESVFRPFWWMT